MIGSEKEKAAKKKLAEDLAWFKKNVDQVGSVDMLKAKYAGGYKRVFDQCSQDAHDYLLACLEGYKYDALLSSEDILSVWGNNSKQMRKIIRTTFNADDITALIADFLERLQENYENLIYIAKISKEGTKA